MGGGGGKLSHEEAMRVASLLVSLLVPACERVVIAGSIRRKCLEVGDLEIVCIPKTKIAGQQTLEGLSRGKRVSVLPHHLETMMREGHLNRHPTDPKMGERYMKLWKPLTPDGDGVSVDIFAVLAPAQWGPIFLLRTGSKEFNLWIVEEARKRGFQFNEGQLLQARVAIPCPEEEDVFRALRMPFVPPMYRSVGPEQRFG